MAEMHVAYDPSQNDTAPIQLPQIATCDHGLFLNCSPLQTSIHWNKCIGPAEELSTLEQQTGFSVPI